MSNREMVDWNQYFDSIRSVCPWAATAWNKKQILVVDWLGDILPLNKSQAIVYTLPNYKPRLLGKIINRLNKDYPEYEFLYSHPKLGINSTSTPVIIQQDKKKLNSIRNTLFKQENNSIDK